MGGFLTEVKFIDAICSSYPGPLDFIGTESVMESAERHLRGEGREALVDRVAEALLEFPFSEMNERTRRRAEAVVQMLVGEESGTTSP